MRNCTASAPLLCSVSVFAIKIYYFYIILAGSQDPWAANSCRASAVQGCFTLRSRVKGRAKCQQFVKFGRLVTDSIGAGDGNLPTFFRKSQPLGGGNDNAQPDRRRGFSLS